MRNSKTHPLRILKTEKVTYSSHSSDKIIPASTNDTHYGVIIHGNIYAITTDDKVGGLIGDNFTTNEAANDTGKEALLMQELLSAIKPSTADLAAALYNRLDKDFGGQLTGSEYESLNYAFELISKIDPSIDRNDF